MNVTPGSARAGHCDRIDLEDLVEVADIDLVVGVSLVPGLRNEARDLFLRDTGRALERLRNCRTTLSSLTAWRSVARRAPSESVGADGVADLVGLTWMPPAAGAQAGSVARGPA